MRLAGRGVGGWVSTGWQKRREDRKSASMTHRRGTETCNFLKKKNPVCLPSKKPSVFNVDQPVSDFNVANPPPPRRICSQNLLRSATDDEGH